MSIVEFIPDDEPEVKPVKKRTDIALPIVVNMLAEAKGKQNMISSKDIMEVLIDRNVKGATDQRIRQIVQYIRSEHKLRGLIATHQGYYLSQDPKEIRDYVHKSYGGRIAEMMRIQKELLLDADYFERI